MLIPESLYGDTIWTHLKLHEVIHVDVVDVDLDIGDRDRWEWDLVRQNGQLFSIGVKSNLLDLADLHSVLYLKLSRHTQLLVLASRDVKHLDE